MIKKWHWVFLASALVLNPAWSESCDKKPTKDLRLMCEAAEQNNPRFCEDISSKDQRLFCMARIQPNSYTCEKISSSSTRFDCLSYVKNKQFSLIWSFNGSKPKN
ncbi:MAG: hypothetical protein RL739_269 [Pseudomonadota bacterium]